MAKVLTADGEIKKQRIRDAARAVLSEKSYGDVLLDDVAKRANVAKGTLYLYFKDKESLCSDVMHDVVDRLEKTIHDIPAQETHLATLRCIAEAEIAFIAENRDFLAHISSQRSSAVGSVAARALKKWFERHVEHLASFLQACIKEGSLRPHDTRQGALFFVALARGFALHELPRSPQKPLASYTENLMDFFLNGVGSKLESNQ